jgi:hypothetical protein
MFRPIGTRCNGIRSATGGAAGRIAGWAASRRWNSSSGLYRPDFDDRQSEAIDPAGDSEEKNLGAAENCPVGTIAVEDADTGEQ